jgi:hypothetical protein
LRVPFILVYFGISGCFYLLFHVGISHPLLLSSLHPWVAQLMHFLLSVFLFFPSSRGYPHFHSKIEMHIHVFSLSMTTLVILSHDSWPQSLQ